MCHICLVILYTKLNGKSTIIKSLMELLTSDNPNQIYYSDESINVAILLSFFGKIHSFPTRCYKLRDYEILSSTRVRFRACHLCINHPNHTINYG